MLYSFEEIEGDLIKLSKQGEFDLITHGCNCLKNMGRGIAKSLKGKYPLAYEIDKNTPSKMGEISICYDYPECIVVNSYTQHYLGKAKWGKDSDYNRYVAIRECMKEINSRFKTKHIGLPLIGCGLAGLKWSKVKKIIKQELTDLDVTIVHYKK